MTIALGVLTRSCIVIAADSEESLGWPAYLKSNVGKISLGTTTEMPASGAIPERARTIIVTGAGDSAYLSALKSQLIDEYINDESLDANAFGAFLGERVKTFHHEHVAPYNDPELRVSLVVGITAHHRQKLWKTSLSTTEEMSPYAWARVGSGGVWAGLPKVNVDPSVEERQVSIAAAYSVFFAKEHAGGCGKNTHLVMVPRNGFYQPGRKECLDSLDLLFRRHMGLESQLRNYVLGLPCPDLFMGASSATDTLNRIIEQTSALLFGAPTPSSPQTSEDQQ